MRDWEIRPRRPRDFLRLEILREGREISRARGMDGREWRENLIQGVTQTGSRGRQPSVQDVIKTFSALAPSTITTYSPHTHVLHMLLV